MPDVLIIGSEYNAVSQTFVRQHITAFANDKEYVYGVRCLFHYHSRPLYPVRMHEKALGKFPLIGKCFTPLCYLQRFIRQRGYKVVLAEFGNIGADVLPVVRKLKLPLVVHFHGYDASSFAVIRQYEQVYKEMFAYASAIVVVSRRMRQDVMALGCDENKIILNPCGPHEDFFSNSPRFDTQTFISVGRFVEKKAPLLTLLAFGKVHKKVPEAKLVMVGDGELLGPCRQMAIALNLGSSVEFTGALPHTQIVQKMNDAIALVQHSIVASNGDSEGTPVAILEAGAAGLPVVATRHAGIPDVVVEGKTGILVDELDTDAMADAMIQLLLDKERAKQMGSNARQHIRKHFSIERHLGLLKDILEMAVQKKQKT